MVKSGLVIHLINIVIFLNVTRFVILLYCCKCVFQLSAVSLFILDQLTLCIFVSGCSVAPETIIKLFRLIMHMFAQVKQNLGDWVTFFEIDEY